MPESRSCISQLALDFKGHHLRSWHSPPDCISQPRPLSPPHPPPHPPCPPSSYIAKSSTSPTAEFCYSQHTHLPVLTAQSILPWLKGRFAACATTTSSPTAQSFPTSLVPLLLEHCPRAPSGTFAPPSDVLPHGVQPSKDTDLFEAAQCSNFWTWPRTATSILATDHITQTVGTNAL